MTNKICFLCGGPAKYDDPLDDHHIWGGALRNKSEKYGLKVPLHHFKCHIFGPQAAHNNGNTMQLICEYGQRKWMEETGGTTEDFIREFYRNYL